MGLPIVNSRWASASISKASGAIHCSKGAVLAAMQKMCASSVSRALRTTPCVPVSSRWPTCRRWWILWTSHQVRAGHQPGLH